jgi:hypothetical protein
MKKPINLSLREHNNLINRNRLGKNRKKEKKSDFKKKRLIKQNPYNKKNRKILVKIDLPQKFDLHENTDDTLEIMDKFRAILDKENPRLKKLNFDAIQYINPLSALMLAAEIDVWNIISSQSLTANHTDWNTEVKRLLCEMGFFELLNIPSLENLHQTDKNTVFLKFISGVGSDGKKAKQLRKNIEITLGKKLENKLHLFDGLSEAFTNTTQHAYDEKKPVNKWWITAAYKKDNNKLIVSMYDRGKSIPTTMHTGRKWMFLNERTATPHNKLLQIAMKSSFYNKDNRTQTQKKNRGKGLKQLLDFVKGQGKLTIISNKGYCAFEVNNNNLSIVKQKELKYRLQGTLIEWDIDLPRT